LLTKRTHIVFVLVALMAFPAVAIAGGSGARNGTPAGLGNAPVAGIALLRGPGDRFEQSIHSFARRLRAERRAAARRRQAIYADLPGGVSLETLDAIASCESGGDPTAVSADGTYRGEFQFDYGTWESVGGHGDPAAASEAEQDYRAALLYERSGSSPWPVCG
jgi:uncharacterized membrane protein